MSETPEVTTSLIRLVQGLVDHPDQVRVRLEERQDEVVFVLRVAPPDVGQVIGRQGRTARALRALLDARSDEDGRSYALEIQRS